MKGSIFLSLFLILSGPVFSSEINLYPKEGVFNGPIKLKMEFSEPIKKVLWTKNPDGPFDETFVYEEKIPIRHTQNIWYFGILGNNISTNYFVSKYEIKVDPNKFNANFKISKISPKGNWIEITNEGIFEKSLHNWVITTRTEEIILPFIRLKAGKSKRFNVDLADFMEVVRLKDPSFLTKYKFRYKSNLKDNEFYFRKKGERVFKKVKIY